MIKTLLYIGMGSFIGGILRYLLSRLVGTVTNSSLPIGTLTVNILGCLFIGFLYGVSERGNILNPDLRLFLTVGFCGGFTTFSTFSLENLILLQNGNLLYFLLYAILSLALGIITTYAGYMLIKML